MGCCAKYAAKLILSLSALAFLALSVVLMYVSVSAFDSPFFEGVVAAVAVGGVVLSLLTAVVACTGCVHGPHPAPLPARIRSSYDVSGCSRRTL